MAESDNEGLKTALTTHYNNPIMLREISRNQFGTLAQTLGIGEDRFALAFAGGSENILTVFSGALHLKSLVQWRQKLARANIHQDVLDEIGGIRDIILVLFHVVDDRNFQFVG